MIQKILEWYDRQDFATQAVIHGALLAIATLSIMMIGVVLISLLVK